MEHIDIIPMSKEDLRERVMLIVEPDTRVRKVLEKLSIHLEKLSKSLNSLRNETVISKRYQKRSAVSAIEKLPSFYLSVSLSLHKFHVKFKTCVPFAGVIDNLLKFDIQNNLPKQYPCIPQEFKGEIHTACMYNVNKALTYADKCIQEIYEGFPDREEDLPEICHPLLHLKTYLHGAFGLEH
jgi:hypothetical protein